MYPPCLAIPVSMISHNSQPSRVQETGSAFSVLLYLLLLIYYWAHLALHTSQIDSWYINLISKRTIIEYRGLLSLELMRMQLIWVVIVSIVLVFTHEFTRFARTGSSTASFFPRFHLIPFHSWCNNKHNFQKNDPWSLRGEEVVGVRKTRTEKTQFEKS